MIITIRRKTKPGLRIIRVTTPLLLLASVCTVLAQDTNERISWQDVCTIASDKLAERDDYRPGDLIHQADVQRVLKGLAAAGWRPADHRQLLADTLPEDDLLVRLLSSQHGVAYMRKVQDEELIFDRLDRVCRVSGGERMLTDIVRLPGGEKLAKLKRPYGVPGFLDLLPKGRSGKVRSIKDYEQPTGHVYTEAQLLERLKESYQGPAKSVTKR